MSSARYAVSPAFAFAFPSTNFIASVAGGSSPGVVADVVLDCVGCGVVTVVVLDCVGCGVVTVVTVVSDTGLPTVTLPFTYTGLRTIGYASLPSSLITWLHKAFPSALKSNASGYTPSGVFSLTLSVIVA